EPTILDNQTHEFQTGFGVGTVPFCAPFPTGLFVSFTKRDELLMPLVGNDHRHDKDLSLCVLAAFFNIGVEFMRWHGQADFRWAMVLAQSESFMSLMAFVVLVMTNAA